MTRIRHPLLPHVSRTEGDRHAHFAVLTIDEDGSRTPPCRRLSTAGSSRVEPPDLPAGLGKDLEYIAAVSEEPTDDVVDLLEQLTAGNTLLLKELPLGVGPTSTLEFDITTMTLPRRVRAADRQLLHLDGTAPLRRCHGGVCRGTAGFAVVPGALNLDDDAALEPLEVLAARPGRRDGGGQVRFVHEAMRLAVYASVPDLTRRRLHEKAAEWPRTRAIQVRPPITSGEPGAPPTWPAQLSRRRSSPNTSGCTDQPSCCTSKPGRTAT